MPLYGNELDRDTNPYDAGLGRVVKLDKPGDFVGRAALEQVSANGPQKQLVGIVVRGRGIARHGYPLHEHGEQDAGGIVTSGAPSPTLGVPIAMGYLPPADTEVGTMVDVAIRGSMVDAEIVPLPFYKRADVARRPTETRRRRSPACRCPRIFATPKITSGCASKATRRSSESPSTPRASWATSCSSSCPATGMNLESAQSFGVIESVKTASDLYCPAAGEVLAVNADLADKPELVERRPVRRRMDDPTPTVGP